MHKDTRPLRKAVRVLILYKDGKVMLGKRIDSVTKKLLAYDFIGGGVEEDQSMEEAVKMECLEEVGVRVKNIRKLSVVDSQRFTLSNPARAKIYSGGEDHYFSAEFDAVDNSLLGSQGDIMPHEIVPLAEAKRKILNGPDSPFNPARVSALEEVIKMHKKKIRI